MATQDSSFRLKCARSTWRGRPNLIGMAVTALFMLPGAGAAETTFSFTKIADSDTPVPGRAETFSLFIEPSIDQRLIAFVGVGAGGTRGLYLSHGGVLKTIADQDTPLPDRAGNFDGTFSGPPLPSIGNGMVAFLHGVGGSSGIYTYDIVEEKLQLVVNRHTFVPGSPCALAEFSAPSVDGETLAFIGISSFDDRFDDEGCPPDFIQGGVYVVHDGTVEVIADTETPIPGGGGALFTLLTGTPAVDGKGVAFNGVSLVGPRRVGVYRGADDTLTVIADSDTVVPGGTGETFDNFGVGPSLSGGLVVFRGSSHPPATPQKLFDGIYRGAGGALNVIADFATQVPENAGMTIGPFGFHGADNAKVAFLAGDSAGGHGIYSTVSGKLEAVIMKDEILDGKVVSGLGLGTESLSGRTIVFNVRFVDGSQGIFTATFGKARRE